MSLREFKNAKKHSLISSNCDLLILREFFKKRKGKKYLEMTDNIFSRVSIDRIHRLDVNFNFPEKFLVSSELYLSFLSIETLIRLSGELPTLNSFLLGSSWI